MYSGKVVAAGTKSEIELKLFELTRAEEVLTAKTNQPKEKCKSEVHVVQCHVLDSVCSTNKSMM